MQGAGRHTLPGRGTSGHLARRPVPVPSSLPPERNTIYTYYVIISGDPGAFLLLPH